MKKRRTRIGLLILALLLAAGGGYFAYMHYFARAEEPAEATLRTATAYRGDIVITADGSGELRPAAEVAVGFQNGGLVTDVAVEVGDQVRAGDVLARLDDTDARQALAQAEMQVTQARLNLQMAQSDAEAGLAQANLEAAQADYEHMATLAAHVGDQVTSARVSLQQAVDALSDAEEAYREAWDPARDWELYDRRRSASLENERERTANALKQAQQALEVAQASYNLAWAGIDNSAVQDARIKVTQAELDLANEPLDLKQLELALDQANLSLEDAQRALERTALTAPMDGTVMDVTVTVGERVGTEPIVTLADLGTPLVCFWVEETDMSSVVVGNPVNVVFEALPDDTFSGEIIQVDPALVTVDGTLAVQAWAALDLTSAPVDLLSGMTADVEVVAGEARNALLVPLEALRELGEDQYAVFVVRPDGELELRPVTVGLKDFVNAEVVAGLEDGEVVSLGTSGTSEGAEEVPEFRPPGGLPFIR